MNFPFFEEYLGRTSRALKIKELSGTHPASHPRKESKLTMSVQLREVEIRAAKEVEVKRVAPLLAKVHICCW